MPSVFISHSSLDKKFVSTLTKALNERGINTWVDDKQIKVGQPIPRRISEGIAACEFFLVVISRAAIQSRWVEGELNSAHFHAARNKSDTILPVLLERVDLPALLQPLRYADFSKSFELGIRDLLRSLEIDEAEIPFLSRWERQAKIRQILSTTDKRGELPSEAISLVEDESYLTLFEQNLRLSIHRRVLINSLYALRFLAGAWDGRRICRHASIPPLLSLYEEADRDKDQEIRLRVVQALAAISSRSTYDFLLARLEEAQPEIVDAILSEWQDIHEWVDGPEWIPKLVPTLYKLIDLPQNRCLYFNYAGVEEDFRFWVFRCLQRLKRKDSRRHIEMFLSRVTWPVGVLVEAAMAYWCVTGSAKYLPILYNAAKRRDDISGAKYFLEKIRDSERKRLRRL